MINHATADDSLALCTESLGFESFDGRMDLSNADELALASVHVAETPLRTRTQREPRGRKRVFPPPLTWLDCGGNTMRSVKKDGRFLLSVVRVEEKTEVFRTSRRDGRLRLQLVEEERETLSVPTRCIDMPFDSKDVPARCTDTPFDTPLWFGHHQFLMPA